MKLSGWRGALPRLAYLARQTHASNILTYIYPVPAVAVNYATGHETPVRNGISQK